MKNIFYYETVIGRVYIADNGVAITNIFLDNGEKLILRDYVIEETELIKKTAKYLKEYLGGDVKEYDIPIELEGTEFQKSVWNALRTIPIGETRSYKDIARIIGKPKACRAVGMANNRNPILIIVPCHRVIGANGLLVGYAGGLELKKKLLNMEKGIND